MLIETQLEKTKGNKLGTNNVSGGFEARRLLPSPENPNRLCGNGARKIDLDGFYTFLEVRRGMVVGSVCILTQCLLPLSTE